MQVVRCPDRCFNCKRTHILKTSTISEGDLGNIVSAHALIALVMASVKRYPESLEHEMLKYGHTYQFFWRFSRFFGFLHLLKTLRRKMTKNFLYSVVSANEFPYALLLDVNLIDKRFVVFAQTN